MVGRLLTLITLLGASRAHAQEPANLGFETEFQGGWKVQSDGDGPCHYQTGRSTEAPIEGAVCATIGSLAEDAPNVWNYFHQYVDAAPYRGRRIRLRAAVRVQPESGARLRLYLAGVDESYGRLAYVDTERRPIVSDRWAYYELVLEVPEESARVNFGLVFYGPLEARLDDVSLEVLAGDDDSPFADAGPWNGDFETSVPGEVPWAWTVPFGLQEVCAAETSEEDPYGGERCAKIETRLQEGTEVALGSLVSSFDAKPYRGRVVELRAWLKVPESEDGLGGAQFGFRVDRPGGQPGHLDDMLDRLEWKSEWTEVVRIGAVARDAERIHVGLVTFSPGTVFLDEVSLEVVGEVRLAGPRPLDERGLRNLVAFTRLLGVVRYFHPSDEAFEVDWHAFAARGIERVEAAASTDELSLQLGELFAPIAPTVHLFLIEEGTEKIQVEIHPALRPDPDTRSLRATRWEHAGHGREGSGLYTSRRRWRFARGGELPAGYRDPASPWIADLGDGLAASVPVALWRDRDGTVPAAEASIEESARFFSGDDRTTRLAATALAWNVFQHFYPYFVEVEVDWHAELERALRAAATDPDEQAFRHSLSRMVAALRDGHGGVLLQGVGGFLRLPVDWEWIEGQLVVIASAHPDVEPGMRVLRIDGVPVEERIAEVEERTSGATFGFRRRSALQELTYGLEGEACTLSLSGADGEPERVTLTYELYVAPAESRPEPLSELEPGIRYVDISRITDEEFEANLPELAAADAVVLDFRGYPETLSPWFFAHLTREPLQSPLWCVPAVLLPDRYQLAFDEDSWTVEPEEPWVSGRLVFLTDSRAVSYAETCMQIVEHHELGPIVGETTAGTNGNVNSVGLPGGYTILWTGMRTLKQDGSVFHGIGVRPTHPVARTVAGVRAGRDELLEAALELARQ